MNNASNPSPASSSEATGRDHRQLSSGSTKLRVFLSYGHDEHATLARQIKADLEQRGHEVWFDAEQLKVGKDWEAYIEQGIEWASGVNRKDGRILILMTPHSVRRPDGFCLNELACALDHHLSVVPVMVAQVEPPLSICRIQWLDLVDCVPIEQRHARYQNKLSQLVDALENNSLNVEGVHSSVRAVLQPISYQADVAQHLPRFTGRKWLFERIDQWIKDPSGDRVFWLTGDPGSGKTAISSKLSTGCPEVAAFHICRYGDYFKADPHRVVLSIAWQLATQLPDLMTKLNNIKNLDEICSLPDAATIFERLIVDPLLGDVRHPNDSPTVILIDGLDEATVDGNNKLCEFLAAEMERAPKWVRFLLTSRAEPEVTQPLQAYSPISLNHDSNENREDINHFLRSQFKSFEPDNEKLERAIEQVMQRSECVFLYVEQIRSELEKKSLKMSDINEFPRGLGGIYASFFKRRFNDLDNYKKEHRPALSIIAAACEPIPVDVVAQAFGWDAYQIEEIPDEWGSLFPTVDGRIKPFHRSVVDWLIDRRKAGPHCVKASEGHHILAGWGWNEYQRGVDSLSDYMKVHLPTHLDTDKQKEKLLECVTNPAFVSVFVSRAGRLFEIARFWQKFQKETLLPTLRASWASYLATSGHHGSGNIVLTAGYLGRLLQHLGIYKDAHDYFSEELALAKILEDEKAQANALYNIGWCTRQQGQFAAAIEYVERARTIYEKILNSAGVAKCLSVKGICHWQQSEDALALESLWRSITLFEMAEDTRDEAEAYNHLGIIYRSLGDFEKALQCLNKARDGHIRLSNSAGLGKCYNSIGTCHWWAGRIDLAIVSYEKANSVNEAFGHQYVLGLTANNLGYIHLEQGNAQKAYAAFSKALTIRREQKLADYEMMDLSGLARAAFHLGHLDDAQRMSQQAILGLAKFETVEDLRRAYYNHYMIMKDVNDDEANLALRKAKDLVKLRLVGIADETLRETLVNYVPLMKEILDLAECIAPAKKRNKLNST
jgi:tetratricopeptide (TPR) repeat protein